LPPKGRRLPLALKVNESPRKKFGWKGRVTDLIPPAKRVAGKRPNGARAYGVLMLDLQADCYGYADFGTSSIKYRDDGIADRNG
jgi:hypothetical protein